MSSFYERKAERSKVYAELKNTIKVICSACNGSGRYDHFGSPKCGQCGGSGKERVPKTDAN